MNKQILTDIVNSILGLSKKKKKEFIELLDDGINGVSEQLNETVEQINQKINNIEPSDFEENDETKSSFIKNRPFYDYEEHIEANQRDIIVLGLRDNKSIYYKVENGPIVDTWDFDVSLGHENVETFIIKFYKSQSEEDLFFKAYLLKKLTGVTHNYGTNNFPDYFDINTYIFNYDNKREKVTDLICEGHSTMQSYHYYRYQILGAYGRNHWSLMGGTNDGGSSSWIGNVMTALTPSDNFNNFFLLSDIKGIRCKIFEQQIEYFKSLDEKFIPDTIKNRITALEQAVIALGGTLNS